MSVSYHPRSAILLTKVDLKSLVCNVKDQVFRDTCIMFSDT